jgi:hypothetical protein
VIIYRLNLKYYSTLNKKKQDKYIFLNIPPQTHDATTTSIESLPTRKWKREMDCDLVKKFAICKEEETKGKVMVSCLRWWRVRDNRSQYA